MRQERSIVVNDQGAAGAGNDGTAWRRFELGLAKRAADIEGGGCHAGCFQRIVSEAGAFADAARGREHAGDGQRKSALRCVIGQRRKKPADVEQNLRPDIERQPSPEVPQRAALRWSMNSLQAFDAGLRKGSRLTGYVHRFFRVAKRAEWLRSSILTTRN